MVAVGLRSGDHYRVLVVDESQEARRLIRSTLEGREHFELVGEAADGVGGVRLATELAPDLIVCDPAELAGDGLAAIHELAATAPDAGLVLFSDAEERERAAFGAHAHVRKSAPPSEILDALKVVAASRSGRTEPHVLNAAEELRRLVFASMTEGVVVQDRTGRVVFSNAAAARILGRSAEAMLGTASSDPQWGAIHPDGRPWLGKETPASQALRTQRPTRDVLMGVRRGPSGHCWLSVTAMPMHDAGGYLAGVVVTFVDVTDRHEAEQARGESDARFRSAIDSMLDAVVLLRAVREEEQIVDFVYEFANAAVEAHAGLPPSALIGRRLLEVVPHLAANGAFERYVDAVETGVPIAMELLWPESARKQGAFAVRGVQVGDGLALTFRDANARASRSDAGATTPGARMPDARMPDDRTPDDRTPDAVLTARELEVLGLLAEGVSTSEISSRLFISLNTSRNHVQRVIAKLGAHSRLEAVAIARRSGVLSGHPSAG